eukprot:SM000202S05869  [mRNA]  locus=s202:55776:57060:- [translate_table: standard]
MPDIGALVDLLGAPEDDAALAAWLADHGPEGPPEVKDYPAAAGRPACRYCSFRRAGLSLCFEGGSLAAVHAYNSAQGFGRCPLPLPSGLRLDMTSGDVVRLLGEPETKAGGRSSGPVLIAYRELGVQFQFASSDWNDACNVLQCVTFYKPET